MRIHTSTATGLVVLALAAAALAPATSMAASGPPQQPITEAATNITGNTATFNGELNPAKKANNIGYFFTYGREGSCEEERTEPAAPVSGKAVKVSSAVSALVPHTEYTVCLVAINAAEETTAGPPVSFVTLPVLPVIEGESAAPSSTATARLLAFINPEQQETRCVAFQYVGQAKFAAGGYSSALEAPCEPQEIDAGSSGETTVAKVKGLSANTTYHFRAVAENGSGLTDGPDKTFLTPPQPPLVQTGAASVETPSSVTISGTVDPGGEGPNSDTSYHFEYGPAGAYGLQTPTMDIGQGNRLLTETAQLTGLAPGTYHYRIVSSNNGPGGGQVAAGEDRTLTTAPPTLGPIAVSALGQTAATLVLAVDPLGSPTRYELRLATAGGTLQSALGGNVVLAGPLVLPLGSLQPGTLYRYSLTAVNAAGASESPEGSLATFAAGPGPGALTQPGTPPQVPIPAIAFPVTAPKASVLGHRETKLTNAQKLARALRACHRRAGAPRRRCERQARAKYAPRRHANGNK